jgi:hypothetical protein
MSDEMKKGVRRAAKALKAVTAGAGLAMAGAAPKVAPAALPVVQAEPEDLYMTGEEMALLELHTARIEMNAAVRDKLAVQEQLLMIEYQNKRDHFRKQQGENTASIERIKGEYNALRERIQQRLGVSLDAYLVQESGRLVPAPADN